MSKFAGTPIQIVRDWREMLNNNMKDPHTLTGMTVPCGTCTACCSTDMPVGLTKEEAQRLPHELMPHFIGTEIENGEPMRYVLAHTNGHCSQYDPENKVCTIYATRPKSCRDFDCRATWLSGMRVHSDAKGGDEFNRALDDWRTEFHSDADIGALVMIWGHARVMAARTGDSLVSAAAALIATALRKEDELVRLGTRARRTQPQETRKVMEMLNTPTLKE